MRGRQVEDYARADQVAWGENSILGLQNSRMHVSGRAMVAATLGLCACRPA
jgi:hypothetical protein